MSGPPKPLKLGIKIRKPKEDEKNVPTPEDSALTVQPSKEGVVAEDQQSAVSVAVPVMFGKKKQPPSGLAQTITNPAAAAVPVPVPVPVSISVPAPVAVATTTTTSTEPPTFVPVLTAKKPKQ